jgi:hypothetical protein
MWGPRDWRQRVQKIAQKAATNEFGTKSGRNRFYSTRREKDRTKKYDLSQFTASITLLALLGLPASYKWIKA